MQAAPAISNPAVSRTLSAAGWVLCLVGAAELAAGGLAFVRHGAGGNPPAKIAVPPAGLDMALSNNNGGGATRQETFTPVDPFAAQASASPAPNTTAAPKATAAPTPAPQVAVATATPAPALPKPTPVETQQASNTPESRLDSLLAQARALRERGDMSTAITRLREALAQSPQNALVLYELAQTFEKMGAEDKALEQWRSIYDLGESAGIYYAAADAKLKAAQLAQTSAQAQTSPPEKPAADSGADNVGFQPGSSLALVNLSTVEKPETQDGLKRFTLKIPVKRRPNIKISVSDVIIQVFFYDQLGDDTVVRTNANVSSQWSELPADWVNDDIEILQVNYTQGKPEPGKIEEGRHYYGYVVCVYYKNELQDMSGDPQDLLKKFPPPLTLSNKDSSQ